MRKIIFIEPKNLNPHIFSQFKLPRLGSFILAALMKRRGWDVEVIFEEVSTLDLRRIAQADLVGISTITPTAARSYALADKLRQSGCTVIMGGPHVTYQVQEALEHCDFVVRGEGEHAFGRFIDAWDKDLDFSAVPSLSYLRDGQIVHNPSCDLITDLDDLPFPDFSLSSATAHYRSSKSITIPVQTSRGCPFQCSFCSVTGMFGRKYRYRSTANILEELRLYAGDKRFIFFCDDNFTHDKQRAKELLRLMIREKLGFQWSTQVRVDVASDPELVELLKQAGCHTLYIGFESVDPLNLKMAKKAQTVLQIQQAVRILKRHRIHVHGMFVYGFDNDHAATLESTLRFAMNSQITSAQFLVLTPFPGTETHRQLSTENRILTQDWSLFDTHHVVIRPKKIAPSELQTWQIRSHERFYSLGQMAKKLISGDLVGVAIGVYARSINRWWKRQNQDYNNVLRKTTDETVLEKVAS